MRRSLLSFALACILTMIPAIANAPVFATDISLPTAPKNSGSWNDYSVSEENKAWYTSGSKNVTLSNTEQFIYLCQMAELDTFEGWSVYIACDLDLGDFWFEPIGAGNDDFRGKLIGAKDGIPNKSIAVRNLFVSGNGKSAFVATANGMTLCNFRFENCHVSGNGGGVAIVCGSAVGGENQIQGIVLNNCTVQQKASAAIGVGLVLGQATMASSATVSVQDCSISNCSLAAAGYEAGAVIGSVTGGSNALDAAISVGDVTMQNSQITVSGGNSTVGSATGGIIGYHSAASGESTALNRISISDCTISAALGYAGGVVGYTTTGVKICGLTSSGNAVSAASGTMVGGVVGSSDGEVSVSGAVIRDLGVSAKGYVGGVLGNFSANANPSVIDNVTVIGGTIAHTTKRNALVGGIAGQVNANLLLINNHVKELTLASPSGSTRVGAALGYVGGGKSVSFVSCATNTVSTTLGTLNLCGYQAGTVTETTIEAPVLLEGASIRTTKGSNGLRFTATVDTASLESAKQSGVIKDYSFGILIAREDKRCENDFFTKESFQSSDIADIQATEKGMTETERGYAYNAAVVGFSEAHKSMQFAARAYVSVMLANGQTARIYSDFQAEKNVRSMEYVANKALADVTDAANDDAPFPYRYPVTFKNGNADGTAFEPIEGVFYSCYTAAQFEILKKWASDAN